MTNAQYALKDETFKKACEIAHRSDPKFTATPRQASKFRNKKGTAYKLKQTALHELRNK